MYTTHGGLGAVAEAKATGDGSIIARDDATKKWARKGKSFAWVKDPKPRGRAGGGFDNDARHVAAE